MNQYHIKEHFRKEILIWAKSDNFRKKLSKNELLEELKAEVIHKNQIANVVVDAYGPCIRQVLHKDMRQYCYFFYDQNLLIEGLERLDYQLLADQKDLEPAPLKVKKPRPKINRVRIKLCNFTITCPCCDAPIYLNL